MPTAETHLQLLSLPERGHVVLVPIAFNFGHREAIIHPFLVNCVGAHDAYCLMAFAHGLEGGEVDNGMGTDVDIIHSQSALCIGL